MNCLSRGLKIYFMFGIFTLVQCSQGDRQRFPLGDSERLLFPDLDEHKVNVLSEVNVLPASPLRKRIALKGIPPCQVPVLPSVPLASRRYSIVEDLGREQERWQKPLKDDPLTIKEQIQGIIRFTFTDDIRTGEDRELCDVFGEHGFYGALCLLKSKNQVRKLGLSKKAVDLLVLFIQKQVKELPQQNKDDIVEIWQSYAQDVGIDSTSIRAVSDAAIDDCPPVTPLSRLKGRPQDLLKSFNMKTSTVQEEAAWINFEPQDSLGYFAHIRGQINLQSLLFVRSGSDKEAQKILEEYGVYGVFVFWRRQHDAGKLVLPDSVVAKLKECATHYALRFKSPQLNFSQMWLQCAQYLDIEPLYLPEHDADCAVPRYIVLPKSDEDSSGEDE